MPITLTAIATLGGYAGFIYGKAQNLRIKTEEDKQKITVALRKSKIFKEYCEKGYSVEEIIDILGLQTARGEEFEEITGVPWPL